MNGNFRAMPPRLLILGDCNPDLILRGGARPRFGQVETLVDESSLTIGGSGSITACGAARLGIETGLIAAVGDDALGRIQLDAVASAGVDVSRVVLRPDIDTGVSVVLSEGDDRAILTSLGAIGSLRADEVGDLDGAEHLHVSALFLLEQLRPDLPALLGRARAAGVTISIDSNWDPTGSWLGTLEPNLAVADILLPNLAEARMLSGESDPERACRALAHEVGTIAIKLGADGAIAAAGDAMVRLDAPEVDVVDTTGAGDSFNAGFIAARLLGEPLEEALALALACGSLSVGATGGTGGQPNMATARSLAARLRV